MAGFAAAHGRRFLGCSRRRGPLLLWFVLLCRFSGRSLRLSALGLASAFPAALALADAGFEVLGPPLPGTFLRICVIVRVPFRARFSAHSAFVWGLRCS